MAILDPVIS